MSGYTPGAVKTGTGQRLAFCPLRRLAQGGILHGFYALLTQRGRGVRVRWGESGENQLRWRIHEESLGRIGGCRGVGAGTADARRHRPERRGSGRRDFSAQDARGTGRRQVRGVPPCFPAGKAASPALPGVPGVPYEAGAGRHEDHPDGRVPQHGGAERHLCRLPQAAACRGEEAAAEMFRLPQERSAGSIGTLWWSVVDSTASGRQSCNAGASIGVGPRRQANRGAPGRESLRRDALRGRSSSSVRAGSTGGAGGPRASAWRPGSFDPEAMAAVCPQV